MILQKILAVTDTGFTKVALQGKKNIADRIASIWVVF